MFQDKQVGVGDFVLLPQITMDGFLDNLKNRHAAGLIYTYIGEAAQVYIDNYTDGPMLLQLGYTG